MIREIVVLSGKGGTGKTTISSSFAVLSHPNVVVDADVDAANLEIVLGMHDAESFPFSGGEVARIDLDLCTDCGLCLDVCRFDAISSEYVVDQVACEGCGACELVCPVNAISMVPSQSGVYKVGKTEWGWMVTAELYPGGSNNGKLVEKVRSEGRRLAGDKGLDLIIIDGPPGIGCPVISSVTGTTGVVAVTEPTLSAIHDLQRLLELTAHFRVKTVVVINRFDVHPENTRKIEEFLKEQGIPVVGKIPFDREVYKALADARPVVMKGGRASDAIVRTWEAVKAMLF